MTHIDLVTIIVDDFDAAFGRLVDKGVEIVSLPRCEPYGRVAMFADRAGNRWDLLGPPAGEGNDVLST